MSGDPDGFLIVPEAAAELRMAKRTLDNHRRKGAGLKSRPHGPSYGPTLVVLLFDESLSATRAHSEQLLDIRGYRFGGRHADEGPHISPLPSTARYTARRPPGVHEVLPSGGRRQLFQRIDVRHPKRCEVAFVRGQHCEAPRTSRGGNGDVLEAGIVSTCPVKDGPGHAGFLEAEGEDTPRIEVLHRREPAAQALSLGGSSDPGGAGDAGLDLGDRYGRDVEMVVVLANPSRESFRTDPALGRGVGRHDIGIEQIHRSEVRAAQGTGGLAGPLGNVIRLSWEGQQQVGEARHLGDTLPLIEGDKDSLLATVTRDDRRLAGDSPVHDGREGRLGVLELEFLHGVIPYMTTSSHIRLPKVKDKRRPGSMAVAEAFDLGTDRGEILHGAGGDGSAGAEPFKVSSQSASSSKTWFDVFPERFTNQINDLASHHPAHPFLSCTCHAPIRA